MLLGDYYLCDPRVVLLPIEHLTPAGLRPAFAAFLGARAGWDAGRIALFDAAFALYWSRSTALAGRTRTWPAPRLRHVAVVAESPAVRPYAQMLNTSAWTLWASDLDSETSHPELAAFLLVHGDHMAATGEVTLAAVRTAAWWFDRSDEECEAFAAAAARSTRPDASGFRAIAAALPWLRRLRHDALRPAARIAVPGVSAAAHRPVPGTGLLVPAPLESEPPALVEQWTRTAQAAVAAFHSQWRAPDADATRALLDWLQSEAPPLLVSGGTEQILWDPAIPERLGPLRQELRRAGGAAVRDITADLRVVAEKTRSFLASLAQPDTLPGPASEPEQRGYAYLHRERRLIAYNLHEPATERLLGPALPYARAMLGARTVHEWCHLAVDAGWVPAVDQARLEERVAIVGELLEGVLRDAPLAVRSMTEADRRALGPRPGRSLAEGLLGRFEDYRANLLATRFLDRAERETYVRQNVRTLRFEYPPAAVFRMLARYLYEYQYLRFSLIADRRAYFLASTWFDDDFFGTRILDDDRFDRLAAAVGEMCESYAVDERWFRRA
jgi:hypothetical protein